MAKLTLLPTGDALDMSTVASISLSPGKGVLCLDSQRRFLTLIRVEDAEKAKQVRQILIQHTQPGMGTSQPDWSFLEQ
ncbi:hypothetical protein LZ012_13865 [Dechloromonas sp. XY25]|uniref:Uncharacterized protein n=1 Tax=Dechloromonas hankyongensis TaxID=2908002 RepID=A0ABS9K4K0_9RHOO|nr:hypothetical protein [Dechloromonas hankyongensis]MCG2578076.1 hypothetical protein [Dechloromonas hankyongensis]